jgi:sugar lactone lactonase YvrE
VRVPHENADMLTAARRASLLARAIVALATAPLSASVAAQTGSPTADSASVARAAWRRANAAMQSGDIVGARAEVERAATAWPTQEAYLWGRVAIAARASDTLAVASALEAYAKLGLGRDLKREPSLASVIGAPALTSAIAKHDANRAPIVRGRIRATIPDSTFWAEGVDHDPRSGSFFVASINRRTIAEVRSDGSVRELIARATKGIGAIFGVRVDPKGGVLWATTSGVPQMDGFTPGDTAIAALLRIRISDGVVERRWNVPVIPGGHVLGDLAIGPKGDVFMTDSNEPVLYRIAPGADSLVPFRNSLFRSLQGIAPTPDGSAIYVADYSHGILRLDLASGAVIRVADASGSVSLGCDGIAWHRGTIVAVQNGVVPARVMRFTLSSDGTRFTNAEVLDRNPLADEPTIGTVVGSEFVYLANSQWEKRDQSGAIKPGALLRKPVLFAVPLGR